MPAFDIDAIRSRHRLSDIASQYGVSLIANGREWQAICPLPGHAEKTPSWQIFAGKDGFERFHCKGCGEFGDVIDFVQAVCGCGFREACETLEGQTPRPLAPKTNGNGAHALNPYEGYAVAQPPENAPLLVPGVLTPPIANPKRGRPTRYTPALVHPYLDANGELTGYVLRVDIGEGRKITPAILWMTGPDGFVGWSHGSMPEPRPLYGLADIAATSGQVLVVEGEKCADAGNAALGGKILVVSWCGGGKAWAKTDWAPLAGRRVVLWPDNDPQGRQTMQALGGHLARSAAVVKIIDPDSTVKGWDIADAIAEGWDGARIIEYAKARARVWAEPQEREVMPDQQSRTTLSTETRPRSPSSPAGGAAFALDRQSVDQATPSTPRPAIGNIHSLHGDPIPLRDELDDYRSHFITDEHGKIKSNVSNNYFWMLRGHPETRGLFAWNDVAQSEFVMARPPWHADSSAAWPDRALTEADIFQAMTWMERQSLKLRKNDARDVIRNIASLTRYNPVWDYLAGLRWDGCPRLQGGAWEGDTVPPLSTEYLGAPDDPLYGTFVTKWHIAAVARAFRPGCKADTMIIFESDQGKKKSTYLRTMATINGHEYFADSIGDITGAGSIMLLQGCWIIEVAELSGFDRKEVGHIKAWLSRTTDRYVPKYEGQPREVPRNYIVAGTHNPSGHGYLKDSTGARRFWPVPTRDIDLERVERDRDQIWAEAVTLYRSGVKWWLSDDEERQADALTSQRRVEHPWNSKIDEVIKGIQGQITLQAIVTAMQIPIGQQSELTAKIINEHLRSQGFVQTRDKSWYRAGEMQQGEML